MTPEDDPLFDPEDDRAEYVRDGQEEIAAMLAEVYFSEFWPESVDT